jgi:hypothetical protein
MERNINNNVNKTVAENSLGYLLFWACHRSDYSMAKTCLSQEKSKDIRPNLYYSLGAAMYHAVSNGNDDIVRLILDHPKADEIQLEDTQGILNMIDVARRKSYAKTENLLKNHLENRKLKENKNG